MNWQQRIKQWIVPSRGGFSGGGQVRPGMYHFQQERDGQFARFHLRVEPDGSALLVACAAEAIWLPPPATDAAWSILSGQPVRGIPNEVTKVVARLLQNIGRPDVRYPVLQLDDPEITGRPIGLAPIQADVLIDAATPLLEIIDKLWAAGIPHMRMRPGTVDELAELLPLAEAVEHAEDIGMITGLRTTARRLEQPEALDRCAGVGLDYVVLPWGVSPELHEALYGEKIDVLTEAVRRVLSLEMTPVLEVAIFEETIDAMEEQLPAWIERGVAYLEVFALPQPNEPKSTNDTTGWSALPPQALRQVATWLDDVSSDNGVEIAWLPPVPVGPDRPISTIARPGPRAGGDLSIRVETDGTVVAPRGPRVVVGNLLTESWENIWHHSAFDILRRTRTEISYCDECPRLDICAVGCPVDPQTWASEAT